VCARSCQRKADCGNHDIDCKSNKSGNRHVENPQQKKACQETPDHGPGDVPAVKKTHPGNALRRRFNKAGNGGKRGAHQHCRGDKAYGGYKCTGENAMPVQARIESCNIRHSEQDQNCDHPDAEFETRIDSEGMEPPRNQPWQHQTPQAHPPHEGSQQHSQGDARGTDDQLQQLQPDDFINERSTAAAQKQRQQPEEVTVMRRLVSHGIIISMRRLRSGRFRNFLA
jgi:hypothetical protein